MSISALLSRPINKGYLAVEMRIILDLLFLLVFFVLVVQNEFFQAKTSASI